MERAAVQFGLTRIEYGLQWSARRRTLGIAVDPAHGVVVTAPDSTDPARVAAAVHAKGAWIVQHLGRMREVEPALPPREFVSGESYSYLGRSYRLRVERAAATATALRGGRLVVGVARGVPPAEVPAAVRVALTEWYRTHATHWITARLGLWARRVGVTVAAVRITAAEKRWASCGTSGTVRVNWRLVQAPVRLVDYVLVHELAHRLHARHDRAFWRAVRRVLPDADERRDALRRLGPRLVW